jgi:AcrR family transcriptional regulator
MASNSPGAADHSPKRRALLDGALAAFAMDGYSRATIDGIAAQAGVSSRTIYNQFGGKAQLFRAVIVDSAQRVAAAQTAVVRQHLCGITAAADVEPALTAFARAFATPDPAFTQHFALVRQIHADLGHIPADVVHAWQEAGPRRVHSEIATQLRRISRLGLLAVSDAETTTDHLVALATAGAAQRRLSGPQPDTREVHRLADAGVRAFLHGYLPASTR